MKMMEYYTDLVFDDNTDAMDVYDTLVLAGFFDKMYEAIPQGEFDFVVNNVTKTIDNIYKYRNSAYGILDALKSDYSDMDLDIEKLTSQLSNSEGLDTVKEILEKMG